MPLRLSYTHVIQAMLVNLDVCDYCVVIYCRSSFFPFHFYIDILVVVVIDVSLLVLFYFDVYVCMDLFFSLVEGGDGNEKKAIIWLISLSSLIKDLNLNLNSHHGQHTFTTYQT